MRKAVFFDIDGTLIEATHGQPQISEASRTAILRLRAQGHLAFIASGRSRLILDKSILALPLDGMVLLNGAVILDAQGKTLYQKPLPTEMVQKLVTLAEARGIEYDHQGLTTVYLRRNFTHLEHYYRALSIDVSDFVRDYDLQNITTYKMEFLAPPSAEKNVFQEFWKVPGLTGINGPYDYKYFEAYAKSESKATGIAHVLKHFGIDVKNSYAFGDGANDLEMMRFVGHPLVMGNAVDALRPLAEHIVPSVDEDGVAYGIAHYILEDEP